MDAIRQTMRRIITGQRLDEQLLVTPKQMDIASDTKSQVIAMIDIDAFHVISTGSDAEIRSKFSRLTTLDDFNDWSEKGEILHIPFLRIQLRDNGTAYTDGHEGRGRAAAMKKAGYERMPIGVQIRYDHRWDNVRAAEHGLKQQYDRNLRFEDIPDEIEMQFREGKHFQKSYLEPILNGDAEIHSGNASKVMAAQGAPLEEAKRPPEFKKLKKNKEYLKGEEREKVKAAGATWSDGNVAVWKSVVNGKTWYVSATHRAFAVRASLKAAINAFDFIKSTA